MLSPLPSPKAWPCPFPPSQSPVLCLHYPVFILAGIVGLSPRLCFCFLEKQGQSPSGGCITPFSFRANPSLKRPWDPDCLLKLAHRSLIVRIYKSLIISAELYHSLGHPGSSQLTPFLVPWSSEQPSVSTLIPCISRWPLVHESLTVISSSVPPCYLPAMLCISQSLQTRPPSTPASQQAGSLQDF